MTETTNMKNARDGEMDLLDLFKRMGRSITKTSRAIGKGFLISAIFLFRNWLPLLISVILGVGTGYLLKITTSSSYTSDLVLRANGTTASELIAYINRLHTFSKEKNVAALTNALSIPKEQIKNITDIQAFWVIDYSNDSIPDIVDYKNTHDIYDTINVRMQDRLDIRVKVKVSTELNIVRNGLINFINSDSLLQRKNRIRNRQNHEFLTRLNLDISELDSLQKVKFFEETRNMQPKNGGQMVFVQEYKTQLIYKDIYSLYKRKQRLETERDLYNDITTVLSDFSIPSKRTNGGTYYAIRVVPVFFILTILILIILANKTKLKEVYKKY